MYTERWGAVSHLRLKLLKMKDKITITLGVTEAQLLSTDLHSIIRKCEEKMVELVNVVSDADADEWDKFVAQEQLDLYTFQRETYRDVYRQIRDSIFRS